MWSLKVLDVENNLISEVLNILNYFPNLEVLNLKKNPIKKIDDYSVESFSKMNEIYLDNLVNTNNLSLFFQSNQNTKIIKKLNTETSHKIQTHRTVDPYLALILVHICDYVS